MSVYDSCKICGSFAFMDIHECPPIWRVWCPEDGETEDDARRVYGICAEVAAERWALAYDLDSSDYCIVSGGDEVTVHVKGLDGEVTRWAVTGEAEPVYTARKLT